MTTTLTRVRPTKPSLARTCLMSVIRTAPVGRTFVRVTLAGVGSDFDGSFSAMGFDQWFRLYLPQEGQGEPVLDSAGPGDSEGWYTRWLALDEAVRPVIRNYTMREARQVDGRWEIDVDFVVHRSRETGQVDGVAAAWALQARPGDRVGMLDQGILFNPVVPARRTIIVADETGVPGVEGVLRSLPPGREAVVVLEVPHDEDRRPLPSPASVHSTWIIRQADDRPGHAAMLLLAGIPLTSEDYLYVVGERSFVFDARAHGLQQGLPKTSIDFCAYWRPGRR